MLLNRPVIKFIFRTVLLSILVQDTLLRMNSDNIVGSYCVGGLIISQFLIFSEAILHRVLPSYSNSFSPFLFLEQWPPGVPVQAILMTMKTRKRMSIAQKYVERRMRIMRNVQKAALMMTFMSSHRA